MSALPHKNHACVSLLVLSDMPEIAVDLCAALQEPSVSVSSLSLSNTNLLFDLSPPCDVVMAYVGQENFEGFILNLSDLRVQDMDTKIIIVDESASPERAVTAMKAGATDYIPSYDDGVLAYVEKIGQICLDTVYAIPNPPVSQSESSASDALKGLRRKIQKVVRAAKILATCNSLHEVCEGLLETLGNALGATGGSLYLVKGAYLEQVHALDPGHAPKRLDLPLEKGTIFEQVFSTGEPLLIANERGILKNKPSGWTGYEGNSVLVYPLLERNGDLIGLFSLHGKENASFTKQDRDLALILASYSHETIRSLLAKEKAEAASASKTNFLANVSHELRTPLNAIIGFSEMINFEVFGPMQNDRYAEYVQHIHESGSHLLRLINNLLDLSKVEAGKFQLHMGSVKLAELVQSTKTYFAHQAEEAGVDLILNSVDDLNPFWADENALRQIFLNLISNAIKFTPKGGQVTVSVEVSPEKDVTIIVADNGIGMETKSIDLALEPFGQIENAFNRKYPGTGLGLPLVVSLSELHGGHLEINSALGHGTTCAVHLPFRQG